MKIKFKKFHPDAVIPTKAHASDAGFDLVAVSETRSSDGKISQYGTGLGIEIPPNHVGLIFARSSIYKTNCRLSNAVGVIDSNYRGEISFNYDRINSRVRNMALGVKRVSGYNYEIGDRIGQLIIIPYPEIEFEEVDELEDSERGESGFGSSGR